jgi:hypothetical protein
MNAAICIPPVIAEQRLGKKRYRSSEHTQQQKNCWTRRFLKVPCRIKGKKRRVVVLRPSCLVYKDNNLIHCLEISSLKHFILSVTWYRSPHSSIVKLGTRCRRVGCFEVIFKISYFKADFIVQESPRRSLQDTPYVSVSDFWSRGWPSSCNAVL